ncbi:MAG: tRNA (guanosine(37)-N1)-methyltransferase TrmD [Thermomicrobiales bacterium]|nr:tRNA (guanosine(37)-N1)-methyltransferase TrmD [Thermomicrobiales bacterium]
MTQQPSLHIDIFTLFPGMFEGPFRESIVARAVESGQATIALHDIRDWTHDRHRSVDDRPYGGGAGMVMMAPPVVESVESVLGEDLEKTRILLMSPAGVRFTQGMAREIAGSARLALICGHYEGIDARVETILGAETVSIGDYVLTGGELPAMVIVDAVARLLPGVIRAESTDEESHEGAGVEYPHFTRPVEYRGEVVPDILLSGHHQNIREWRAAQAAEVLERRNQRETAPPGDQTE